MKTIDPELRSYAQMGMAAMLPGMEYALELMQRQINEIRESLSHLQQLDHTARNLPAKRQTKGWSDDPEERRAEMARRMQVARAKVKGQTLSDQRKREWQQMSPRKRKARLAAMAAGKNKSRKQHPAAHTQAAAA
jgi:hypothetical protein